MKPDSSRSNGIRLYKVGFNRREKLLEASVRDRISRWLEGHLAIFYKNVNLMRPARCDPDIALGQVWGRPEVKKIQGSMSQQGTDAERNCELLSQLIVD